jgi:hypothetical protein
MSHEDSVFQAGLKQRLPAGWWSKFEAGRHHIFNPRGEFMFSVSSLHAIDTVIHIVWEWHSRTFAGGE